MNNYDQSDTLLILECWSI